MKIHGHHIVIGISLIVILVILGYIGIYSLPQVLKGFWQLIVLGAAIATLVLMLIWNHRFEQQSRQYAAMLEQRLEKERDAVDDIRRQNMAVLEQITARAKRAEQLERAALKHRTEADAKVESMEYKLRNGLAMVRRIKTRDEKRKGREPIRPN